MKHSIALFFNEWDLSNFSHTEYASLFMLRLYRQSAQNAPSAQVNVSARLFCGCVLQATTCRNTAAKLKMNSVYYNSVLIIMLCIWQSHSKSLILLLFALLAMRAEEIINNHVVAYYNEALLLQRNSTKCISHEIHNSRPIYTIKQPKCFEITCTYLIKK